MESISILPPHQDGFHLDQCTLDQILYLPSLMPMEFTKPSLTFEQFLLLSTLLKYLILFGILLSNFFVMAFLLLNFFFLFDWRTCVLLYNRNSPFEFTKGFHKDAYVALFSFIVNNLSASLLSFRQLLLLC